MKEVNDETILLKKKPNKITIALVVVGILMIVGIIGGLSYALWTYTTSQGTVNKVTSDCLKVSITDETDVISLANAYPLTDEEAENLSPYTFKVTNKCNTEIVFDVNLEIMDVTSRLNSDFIAVSFNGGAKSILSSKTSVDPTYAEDDYTAVEAYKIGGVRLAGGKSESYTLRLWMDESVTVEDDVMNKKFISKINVTATVFNPICKRATELHDFSCYGSVVCNAYQGSDAGMIYGNDSTTPGTLVTGDPFDCDVNGDGTYDATTERFYYVSDYYDTKINTFDDSYATLIYSNNVANGVINNAEATYFRYGSTTGPDISTIQQLPTTTQWPNVSLKDATRSIRNEKGGTTYGSGNLPTAYSYAGYAARFLTYKEVEKACYKGTTSLTSSGALYYTNCEFLLENTSYANSGYSSGYWLETYNSSYGAWQVSLYDVALYNAYYTDMTDAVGVRPVIDVAKTSIEY